jgi:SAM-dependent methyltransferase
MSKIIEHLICPRCHCTLMQNVKLGLLDSITCLNLKCQLSEHPFLIISGVPCLIDFEKSVFNVQDISETAPKFSSITWRRKFMSWLEALSVGSVSDGVSSRTCERFMTELKQRSSKPAVLIIGGGTVGAGTSGLYKSSDLEIVGTDVFLSANVDVVCDGHSLPFESSTFDGVWIQAVLEHVLEPAIVVNEIHRVLRPEGIVYAETPFMQQVHMGAYDFQRFTKSGHRWLFRHFTEIESGVNGGVGLSLVWSVYYFLRALTRSNLWWQPIRILIGWLTRIEKFTDNARNLDGACGLYFLGQRSETTTTPKEIIKYYGKSNVRG